MIVFDNGEFLKIEVIENREANTDPSRPVPVFVQKGPILSFSRLIFMGTYISCRFVVYCKLEYIDVRSPGWIP